MVHARRAQAPVRRGAVLECDGVLAIRHVIATVAVARTVLARGGDTHGVRVAGRR